MTSPLISAQWPEFILPITRREWELGMNAVPSPTSMFFGEDTSTASEEYSQGVGNGGIIPEYGSDTAEGAPGALPHDHIAPLFEATFTHKEYADTLWIQRKLVDDNRTGVIRRKATTFGQKFGLTIATHQASVFNNAFDATNHAGPDAVALCSASHPYNKEDATVINNLGTSALGYDAVVAALAAGKKMVDDRGNPMPSFYDVLLVPPELEAQAYTICNSLQKPGGANNDVNYARSKGITPVCCPYLTDANNWFMIDSLQSKLHLLWYWRVRPELDIDPRGSFQLVAGYRGYMRYSFGWDDFRWIYGAQVS